MKKIGILGGLSFVFLINTTSIGCSNSVNYTFQLRTDRNEIIDIFDKRDVKEYYFKNFFDDDDVIQIVINFNSNILKDYGFRSGDIAYWLEELVKGLGLKPEQEKYKQRAIPRWAWELSGLWDYENNRPKE